MFVLVSCTRPTPSADGLFGVGSGARVTDRHWKTNIQFSTRTESYEQNTYFWAFIAPIFTLRNTIACVIHSYALARVALKLESATMRCCILYCTCNCCKKHKTFRFNEKWPSVLQNTLSYLWLLQALLLLLSTPIFHFQHRNISLSSCSIRFHSATAAHSMGCQLFCCLTLLVLRLFCLATKRRSYNLSVSKIYIENLVVVHSGIGSIHLDPMDSRR